MEQVKTPPPPKAVKPKKCKRLPVTASLWERAEAHKAKMARKAAARRATYPIGGISGSLLKLNPRTGKPHKHERECARRIKQGRSGQ